MLFKTIYNKLYKAGDKLEDKVRGRLSHYPLIYALIGGVGIVLFWRGVWHTADHLMERLLLPSTHDSTSISHYGFPWWDGALSVFIGTPLLLTAGLLSAILLATKSLFPA